MHGHESIEAPTMDGVRTFLESSTIHGLAYISTTRRLVKLFWIGIVIAGFLGAAIMIFQSFQSWKESPVKTTLETLSIKNITFPKVTVCPPKKTYTDLNYELIRIKNHTLDKHRRNELTAFANGLLESNMNETLYIDLNKLQEHDRYYNWYHGYSKFNIPTYKVDTSAPFGNIHTTSYGKKFDTEAIETNLHYNIKIYIPESVRRFKQKPYGNNDCRYPDGYDHNDRNIYLNIEVDKVTMRDILSGKDELRIGRDFIKPASRKFVKVYNEADFHNSYTYIQIVLDRKVSLEDIRKLNLHMMPGFNVTWYYSVEDFLDRKYGTGRKNYSLEEFNYYYHKDKYECYIGKRASDSLHDGNLELYRRYKRLDKPVRG